MNSCTDSSGQNRPPLHSIVERRQASRRRLPSWESFPTEEIFDNQTPTIPTGGKEGEGEPSPSSSSSSSSPFCSHESGGGKHDAALTPQVIGWLRDSSNDADEEEPVYEESNETSPEKQPPSPPQQHRSSSPAVPETLSNRRGAAQSDCLSSTPDNASENCALEYCALDDALQSLDDSLQSQAAALRKCAELRSSLDAVDERDTLKERVGHSTSVADILTRENESGRDSLFAQDFVHVRGRRATEPPCQPTACTRPLFQGMGKVLTIMNRVDENSASATDEDAHYEQKGDKKDKFLRDECDEKNHLDYVNDTSWGWAALGAERAEWTTRSA